MRNKFERIHFFVQKKQNIQTYDDDAYSIPAKRVAIRTQRAKWGRSFHAPPQCQRLTLQTLRNFLRPTKTTCGLLRAHHNPGQICYVEVFLYRICSATVEFGKLCTASAGQ
eukprot:GEMP01055340.1.p3 GENE.GEMP01055340.1~~GEMP01055340.1.p3  ORF type:complete len:111 (+),score=15.30 GEMP01055340.1:44-376(+)